MSNEIDAIDDRQISADPIDILYTVPAPERLALVHRLRNDLRAQGVLEQAFVRAYDAHDAHDLGMVAEILEICRPSQLKQYGYSPDAATPGNGNDDQPDDDDDQPDDDQDDDQDDEIPADIMADAEAVGLADLDLIDEDDDGQGDALASVQISEDEEGEGQADACGDGLIDQDRGQGDEGEAPAVTPAAGNMLMGSITDGQITFGASPVTDEDLMRGPMPPTPAGIFGPLLTALDPYRLYEFEFPEVFTPAMQSAIFDISKDKELPPRMISGIVLGWISALILRTRAIWYKPGWTEHGNLYLIVVAPSGVGKSHAVKYVFKDIVRAEAKRKAEWKAKIQQYAIDLKKYKNSKKGDEVAPKRPTDIQYLIDDATLEAVSELLEDNPRGMFWEVDEMSGWFAELDRYNKNGSGAGKKKLYAFFDVKTLSVTRKSQDGMPNRQHYPGACVGILGGIQTGVLPTLFTPHDREQGLPNRFLYLPVDEINDDEITDDTEISHETNELIRQITTRGLDLEMDVSPEGGWQPHYIRLDNDARREFVRFRNVVKRTTKGTAVFEFLRKMQSLVLRIALLLHYLEYLENHAPVPGNHDDTRYSIDGRTMKNALKVITHFVWGLRTVWEGLGYEDEQEIKEDSARFPLEIKLREFIDKHQDACEKGLTTGEFFDLGLKKSDFTGDKELRQLLRDLRCEEKRSNGRRFYPLSIIEKRPQFGIPSKPTPKVLPARRGMKVTPMDTDEILDAADVV